LRFGKHFVDESFHTLLLWFFAGQVLVRGVLSQFSESNAVSLSFVKRWESNREKKLTDYVNTEQHMFIPLFLQDGVQTFMISIHKLIYKSKD
jgi:hypothetical protein